MGGTYLNFFKGLLYDPPACAIVSVVAEPNPSRIRRGTFVGVLSFSVLLIGRSCQ